MPQDNMEKADPRVAREVDVNGIHDDDRVAFLGVPWGLGFRT